MSAPTRRGLLASAAGLVTAPVAVSAKATTMTVTPSADAELISACTEWLRISRAFNAYYVTLTGDIQPDDPGWAMLAPQGALEEKIVALRASTAEGFFIRAQCMAFVYLPQHSACTDNPEAAAEDRFASAMLRDLSVAEWGVVA